MNVLGTSCLRQRMVAQQVLSGLHGSPIDVDRHCMAPATTAGDAGQDEALRDTVLASALSWLP